MAEEIAVDVNIGKEEKYRALLPQLEALVSDEKNEVANMANISAALMEVFHFFWVGFYIVDNESLVLGPFQGPVACTRISPGKGVCGKVWSDKKTAIVPDVDEFPGHIACNSGSRSEIVVPGLGAREEVSFVLDVDSDQLDFFDKVDQAYLEKIVQLLAG